MNNFQTILCFHEKNKEKRANIRGFDIMVL